MEGDDKNIPDAHELIDQKTINLCSKNHRPLFKLPSTLPSITSKSQTKADDKDAQANNYNREGLNESAPGTFSIDSVTNSASTENATTKPISSDKQTFKKEAIPPISYKEPAWGGLAPPSPGNNKSLYTIEELKSGTIVAHHRLMKSYQVIGRLPSCDIQLEHPSLSRYHAVLQFKASGSADRPAGFYLYDLGSTHGTFHNKNRCFPKTYYRLRVGHTMKFGGSTRLLILQGPEEDTEVESELSVTELKELAAEKTRKRQEENHINEEKEKARLQSEEAQGISWGMPEDAVEEDAENKDSSNPNLYNNPFSIIEPENENLYLKDPKKTLRGWFEREGYDLEYDCQEMGYAKFKCSVKLPVEDKNHSTAEVVAEATINGKKKEAVVACALEACRILDRKGLLRSSTQESRSKRIARKWEEDDFYDSDEDEFLDRTGALKEKRLKRINMVQNQNTELEIIPSNDKQAVETYESLNQKHDQIGKEVLSLQKRIDAAKESISMMNKHKYDSNDQDLDAYMATLERSADCSKEEINKLKSQLSALQSESRRLERLIEIAKPTKMPQLKLPGNEHDKTEKGSSDKRSYLQKTGGIMVGKMYARGNRKLKSIQPPPPKKEITPIAEPKCDEATKLGDNQPHYNEKNYAKLDKSRLLEEREKALEPCNSKNSYDSPIANCDATKTSKVASDFVKATEEAEGALKYKDVKLSPMHNQSQDKANTIVEKHITLKQHKMGLNSAKDKTINEEIKLKKVITTTYKELSEKDDKYSNWLPPKNQTGDGRTNLNDKYGY